MEVWEKAGNVVAGHWFDHHVKGEPTAGWILLGESWVERARRIGG